MNNNDYATNFSTGNMVPYLCFDGENDGLGSSQLPFMPYLQNDYPLMSGKIF